MTYQGVTNAILQGSRDGFPSYSVEWLKLSRAITSNTRTRSSLLWYSLFCLCTTKRFDASYFSLCICVFWTFYSPELWGHWKLEMLHPNFVSRCYSFCIWQTFIFTFVCATNVMCEMIIYLWIYIYTIYASNGLFMYEQYANLRHN